MNLNLSSSLRQSGVSLMELMIAITIGFVVVAGVGYVYVSSRQTFRTQNSMSAIQENSRFALDTMSYDIRMAGYMGCGNFSSITITNISSPAFIIPTGGLQVFPGGTGWTAPTGITRVAGDVLRVALAQAASGVTLTGNMGTTNANIQISGASTSNFQANDVLMVGDCQDADVFKATGVSNSSGTVTITHTNSTNSGNNLSKLYGTSPPPPALVYRFRQIDYFVGCPTVSWTALSSSCSVPVALYQVVNGAVQPLVDNVENMYFSLGVDTAPPAKILGAYQTPAVVAAASNWANVLTVQIHLLMVGGPANDTGSNVAVVPQTYTFNGATSATPDRRMRQEAIASVGLRNHLP